jgi:hypothetical protein
MKSIISTLLLPGTAIAAAAAAPAWPTITSGGSWFSGLPASYTSAWSAFQSYTAAHPSGFNSADLSSFTSAYGPIPTPFAGGAGFPGGFGAGWFGSGGFPFGSGSGGWNPASMTGGPFGPAGWGPFGNGNGSWAAGPWTSWWDGSACPGSTWTGWTSSGTDAPWTSWTACTASATSTVTYTSTVSGTPEVFTSVGYKVAEATASSSVTDSAHGPVSTGTASSSPSLGTNAAGIGREVKVGAIGAGIGAFVLGVLAI